MVTVKVTFWPGPRSPEGVLAVIYLVFTEGYAATSGKVWIRRQLCEEAIRLGRLLCELIPRNPDLRSLLALMLLHDSRRMARAGPDEEIVTLIPFETVVAQARTSWPLISTRHVSQV